MEYQRVRAGLEALASSSDTKSARTSIETLTTVFRNARSTYPENGGGGGNDHSHDHDTHRVLRLSNERVRAQLWSHSGAREVLLNGGWIKDEARNELRYIGGRQIAGLVLNVLEQYRTIRPKVHEWTPGNKVVDNSKAEEEARQKAEAMKERDKEYAECLKDMRERHELAAKIKAEHRADLERRRNNSYQGQARR